MNIGSALQKIRKDKGFRQNEVSRKTKLTQTYISQIEAGLKNPSAKTIQKLEKFYGVPTAIIMWYALTEKDIKKDKVASFSLLKPTIDNLIKEIFN